MKNNQGFFAFNILLLLFILFTSVSDAWKTDDEFYEENISPYSLIKDDLKSPNTDIQIEALAQIRTLLSTHDSDNNEKFDEIIENEMLPILVDSLRSKNSEIQERAAWILTHMSIFSPKHAKEVVNAGGISPFIYLIDSNNLAMKEESLWALQAIAHRNKKDRDYAIANGIISKIVKIVMFDEPAMNIEHRVAELIKAILVHSDISIPALKELLPAINKLLSSNNDEVISQILQSLYFTIKNDEISQLFLDDGIAEKLVPFLNSENSKFRAIALPVIGNLCYSKPEKIKIFLDLGILKFLPKLLNHKDTRENALLLKSTMKSDEELKEILNDYEINEIQNTKMEL